MKLTSKMLKKIILEEMEALKEAAHYQDPTPTMFTGEPELDPEVPPMSAGEAFEQKMDELLALISDMAELKVQARAEKGLRTDHPSADNFTKWASDALYALKRTAR